MFPPKTPKPTPSTASYGERKKAWAGEWQRLRRDFLSGRLADAIVLPVDEDRWRWECPFCGAHGTTVASEPLALTAGRGHMQTHVTDDDAEALEDLKVLRMPADLLTPFQRERRARLTDSTH